MKKFARKKAVYKILRKLDLIKLCTPPVE